MKRRKKYLALLLAALLMAGNVMPAYAKSENEVQTETEQETVESENVAESETFTVQETGEVKDPSVVQERDWAQGIATFSIEEYSGSYGNELEAQAREIYDAMVSYYVEQRMGDNQKITLDNAITFRATVEGSTVIREENYEEACQKVSYAMQAAIDAFTYDYPEIYWMRGGSYRYSIAFECGNDVWTGIISEITYEPAEIYTDAASNMNAFDSAVSGARAEILKRTNGSLNRYALIKSIHDYVCEVAYYHFLSSAHEDYMKVHSPEPIFIGDGGVVCEGYAKAVKILCDQFEIPCVLVSGGARGDSSSEYGAHMWNYVQMENGRWYLIDATWDDQNSKIYDTYFLAGYESQGFRISIGEERSENPDFSDAGGMTFTYPVLSGEKYKSGNVLEDAVIESYTINYDGNGGKSAPVEQQKNKGEILKLSTEVPTRSGYTFIGWAKSPVGNVVYAPGDSYSEDANITLYAQWKLNAPAQVDISKISGDSNKLTVTWGKVADAAGYEVYMATSQDGSYSKIASISKATTLSYTKTGLSAGKTYYFKVRAYRKDSTQTVRGNFSVVKNAATNPGTPSITSLTGQANAITVKWKKVSGATGYVIYRATSAKGTYSKVATAGSSASSYKVTKLTANKNYYFKIRAYRKGGMNTAYSNYSGIKYTGTATATPKLNSVSSGRKQLTLKWSKVANAAQYEVYMASSSRGNYTKVATLKSGSTSYTKTGLKDGTTYYFKIRTVKNVNGGKAYSSYSGVKSKTTTAVYYITQTGKSYHRASCATTKRSKNLKTITLSEAQKKGYKACKVCKP